MAPQDLCSSYSGRKFYTSLLDEQMFLPAAFTYSVDAAEPECQ